MANKTIYINWKSVEDEINKYLISINWDLRCKITNQEKIFDEYAEFAFFGRGPGKQPPIIVINGWIAKHSLKLNAFAIAKNISKYGTEGNPKVFDEIERIANKSLVSAIDADAIITSSFGSLI